MTAEPAATRRAEPLMTRVTVRRGVQRVDVSAPAATPLADVLHALGIETAVDAPLVLSDGRRLDPTALLGTDVPNGAVVAVAATVSASERRALEHRERQLGGASFTGRVLVGLLVLALQLAVLVPPLVRHQPWTPSWVRWVAVALGTVVALAATRVRSARTIHGALLLPILFAVPALGAVAPQAISGARMAVVVALCVGFAVGFLGWLSVRDAAWSTAAVVWLVVWVVVAGALVLGVPTLSIATTLLVLGVLALLVVPGWALRVPEAQLLDVGRLMTLAPSAHEVRLPEAGRITTRRVRHTLTEANRAVAVATTLAAAVVVALAPVVAEAVDRSLVGRCCGVLLVCTAGVLLAFPRTSRLPVVRWASRVAAVVVLASLLVGQAHTLVHAVWVAAALVGCGVVGVLVGVVATRDPRPVLLARVADIGQSLATLGFFVSAVVASGLWHLMIQLGA